MCIRDRREYRAGDSAKRIHWKATLRAGDYMVRDYMRLKAPKTAVIIDLKEMCIRDRDFISHVIPFENIMDAFRLVEERRPDTKKIVISYED